MTDNMVKSRDRSTGKYVETVSDDGIVQFLVAQDGAGTADVAEYVGFEQASAYRRLRRLEDAGAVSSRRIGGSLFWEADE